MKTPRARGAPVSADRMSRWVQQFRFYREPPDEAAVTAWLKRFAEPDRDVAARILDCIEIVSEKQIHEGYKDELDKLPGWDRDRRVGRWFFVGFGRPAESGAAMLRVFREANRLTEQKYDSLFCNMTELPAMRLTAHDRVVFVDDFSGTGRQICNKWPVIQELIASSAKCYLVLTAATQTAIEKIGRLANLTLLTSRTLQSEDNFFHSDCKTFTPKEKATIESYGKKADSKIPKGYGDCGLLFVLSHKTPNNTIPILHANNRGWRGIFPRTLSGAQ